MTRKNGIEKRNTLEGHEEKRDMKMKCPDGFRDIPQNPHG